MRARGRTEVWVTPQWAKPEGYDITTDENVYGRSRLKTGEENYWKT